jgi:hypothetical protein
MPSKPISSVTVEELLAGFAPDVRALAEELRAVVKATVPEAREAARPGWRSIAYSHARVGYFCGLFPQRDSVTVVLEWGVLLDDPHGLFDGGGRQAKYVPVRSLDTLNRAALADLLIAAVSLPPSRAARVEMARAINSSTKV